jgi:hypothetical protein
MNLAFADHPSKELATQKITVPEDSMLPSKEGERQGHSNNLFRLAVFPDVKRPFRNFILK